ncbi:DUF2849 domain-containing protein [Mangrovicella endophytica]|uniref:DUF2849 domain-containing protein n=1 Tax=Mangrovicella endophytica TaxID=2066697 RepID=UPI000C9EBFA5|nr:DUF2849 domain-containing protein [Mangrovicella endophytica]
MADVKAAAKAKGPKLPVILIANDLLDGDVVFFGAQGWTRDPRAAKVAFDAETAAFMEAEGRAGFVANIVVDPYLVPVEIDAAGFPVASHYREAMRQKGPSIHPDMGKQADYPLGA